MMGHEQVDPIGFRNPYRDLAVGLGIVMLIGAIWALTPWFPWS